MDIYKKEKKPTFNAKAYRHAISMIESNGGKILDNPRSSAAGKYHFLYHLIKDDPDMNGISKRNFMNRPDLQELIMDKALNGKLKGYTYGPNYAKRLKSEYKTDYDTNDLTALVHFLGPGNTRKYLADPENFKVPGAVNATAQQYVDRFRKHFNKYNEDNVDVDLANVGEIIDYIDDVKTSEREAAVKQVDNTRVVMPKTKDVGPQGIPHINLKQRGLSQQQSSGLKVLESMSNNFKEGGVITGAGGAKDLVTLFEGGGTHEQNPNGGIPQGTGSNGKPNLVEEGETKWNDYIFSNAIGLDGTYKVGYTSSNVFEGGGDVDPPDKNKKKKTSESKENALATDPAPVGPIMSEASKYPIKLTKTQSKFHTKGRDLYIDDIRENYTGVQIPFQSSVPEGEVDFQRAVQDEGSQAFLERYNNPWTRDKMKEQTGLSDYDIDNMILRGLEAKKEIGGNVPGSKASYHHEDHVLRIAEDSKDDSNIETHERVHASGFDAAQGNNLLEILGNSFDQKGRGLLKRFDKSILRYLNQPHEAYGNFSEFREKIGFKPGEKIDVEELKKRVKKTGAGMENFYRAFSDENIVNALNTIAYQDSGETNNEYKIA